MKATLNSNLGNVTIDFSKPISISFDLKRGNENPLCFYADGPIMEPLKVGGFVGSVAEGGSCNCEVLTLTPHCQGTHTECIGHLTGAHSINKVLKQSVFTAKLITVNPSALESDDVSINGMNGDRLIRIADIGDIHSGADCLIIRTLPNGDFKKTAVYSGNNPTYFHPETTEFIREAGYHHLMCDLPSVDREEDGGHLRAHKGWWNYPQNPQYHQTITELIYVPEEVTDGIYIVQVGISPVESDASPSKIQLYKID